MKLSDLPHWRWNSPEFPEWLRRERERHCIGDDASGWRCAWKVDGEPCGALLGAEDLVCCEEHEIIRERRAKEAAAEKERRAAVEKFVRLVSDCELLRELPNMPFARIDTVDYCTDAPAPFQKAARHFGPKSGNLLLLGPPGTWKTATTVALAYRLAADAAKQADDLSYDDLVSVRFGGEQYWDSDQGCLMRHPELKAASDESPIIGSLLVGGFWTTAQELATARRKTKLGQESPIIERAKAATLLIIDELGPQAPTDREQVVFEIIDHRYTKKLQTVCTSGLPEAEFRALHGDGLWRRLTEKHVGRVLSAHEGGA